MALFSRLRKSTLPSMHYRRALFNLHRNTFDAFMHCPPKPPYNSARAFYSASTMTKSKTYQDAIAALNSLQSNADVIEKARKTRDVNASKNIPWMERLLSIMDIKSEDLDKLNVIHVSGTKGKGSTCAFTESILRSLGCSTGFFSSPHLVAVRERIRLRGIPISEALFTSYFWDVYEKLTAECLPEEIPPYFKFLTVMSYYVFVKEQVDVAIVEVGIGGAYDCTNVIRNPAVCGVASLGYDHMSLLGHTLPEIAWHKAGIFKPGCPAITVPQPDEAMAVLRRQAEKIGTPLYLAPDFNLYPTETELPVELGLNGDVQHLNASLALQLCKMWLQRTTVIHDTVGAQDGPIPLSPFQIRPVLADALEDVKWPGRFQRITFDSVEFFLDGAHTKESVQYCAEWYRSSQSSTRRKILVFNSTADRNPESLLRPLVDCGFDFVVFCPNNLEQAVTAASDLANFTVHRDQQVARCSLQETVWKELHRNSTQPCLTYCFSSVTETFRWIQSQKDQADTGVEVLVTGSLHLVGAMLTLLDPTLQETL